MKRFNFKKAAVIFGAILSIALIALITLNKASIMTYVTRHEKQIKLSEDSIQSGFAVCFGDYIYFTNPSDGDKIYKVKTDGTGIAKVSDDSSKALVLYDNWIYYSNSSDGFKLYRINVDGTNRTEMTKGGANYISVSTSGVYYSNIKDGDKLYRIGLNGKGNIRLSDEAVSYINVIDNIILYRNGSQKIIKINSDGTDRTVIEDQKVSFVKVDYDGKIYYSLQSDNRSLYCINQNGGTRSKIIKTTTFYAEPLGEWVYFINDEMDNYNIYASNIYRVKKDGTDLQQISIERTEEFCIQKNRVFYKSAEDKGKIYSMNLNGSQRKALEGKTIANSVTEICRALKDNVDFDVSDKKMSEVYKKAKEVLAVIIKPDMSELEKEISIHDYLVKNVKYDYEVLEALNNNFVINLDSHDAYNVLIKGKGVCDGFAWTTKLLLGMCGIDSDVITGAGKIEDEDEKESKPIYHAWNIVKINNKYYHLDVTWDENIYEQIGTLRYMYFNISDDLMAADHKWNKQYYKKCISTTYDFLGDLLYAARDGSTVYYSNDSDNYKLYRINIDGSEKKKINNHRSLFIAFNEGWVYYSDYEEGGALYKISTEGKNKTKLSSDWCTNIEVKDGYVEYVNHHNKKKYRIKI